MGKKFKYKAGIIPYYIDENDKIWMLFIVSSNPKFGGPFPSIAKGKNDPFETPRYTAMREASEELSINISKFIPCKFLDKAKILGKKLKFDMYVYMIRCKRMFDIPSNAEISHGEWIPEDQIYRVRRPHQFFARKLVRAIRGR